MPFAITAIAVIAEVLRHFGRDIFTLAEGAPMRRNHLCRHIFNPYAVNCRRSARHVAAEQTASHPQSLEQGTSAIAAHGAYTHFRHNLEHPFVDSLDVMLFGPLEVKLQLFAVHEVFEYGECHVRIDRTGSIPHQQGHVHHLAYLAALYDYGYLRALGTAHQMLMHGRKSQQRGYGSHALAHVAVGEHHIVIAPVDGSLRIAAKQVEGPLHCHHSPFCLKEHGERNGAESLILKMAQHVEFAVADHGRRHHHDLA